MEPNMMAQSWQVFDSLEDLIIDERIRNLMNS